MIIANKQLLRGKKHDMTHEGICLSRTLNSFYMTTVLPKMHSKSE